MVLLNPAIVFAGIAIGGLGILYTYLTANNHQDIPQNIHRDETPGPRPTDDVETSNSVESSQNNISSELDAQSPQDNVTTGPSTAQDNTSSGPDQVQSSYDRRSSRVTRNSSIYCTWACPLAACSTNSSSVHNVRTATAALASYPGGGGTAAQTGYLVVNDSDCDINPELSCLIIGSHGNLSFKRGTKKVQLNDPEFLPGVGEDVDCIQSMLEKDPRKEIYRVFRKILPSEKHLSSLKEDIEECMTSIKLKYREKGLLIWYTGHGKWHTGDWPMEGGDLEFKDIYDLYKRFFMGRPLYIVTDCCYSGAWVVKCAELLDQDGIQCGNRSSMNIKVFAACPPHKKAYDKFYIQVEGVMLHTEFNGYDLQRKTICFAEHRKLYSQRYHVEQYTLGVDFTRYRGCVKDKCGECNHRLTWTEYVHDLIEQNSSCNYLM